jgi:hypothetical protein
MQAHLNTALFGFTSAFLIVRVNKKTRIPRTVSLFFLDYYLVRECDVRWNSIETSLALFYRKMLDLGFTFDGSDVLCPNHGETSNV